MNLSICYLALWVQYNHELLYQTNIYVEAIRGPSKREKNQ